MVGKKGRRVFSVAQVKVALRKYTKIINFAYRHYHAYLFMTLICILIVGCKIQDTLIKGHPDGWKDHIRSSIYFKHTCFN